MRKLVSLVFVLGACGGGDDVPATGARGQAALNVTPPEPPAIAREVHLVDGGAFTRPAIPPLRSSLDGRVAIEMTKEVDPDSGERSVAFSLFVPEALSAHWAAMPPGVIAVPGDVVHLAVSETYGHPWVAADTSPFDHRTLCDGWPVEVVGQPSWEANPFPCPDGEEALDCYDLTVVSDFEGFDPADGFRKKHRLYGKPVRVKVADPKTAAARITEVVSDPAVLGTDPLGTGTDIRLSNWFDVDFMLEPMITRDGHLLVLRLGHSMLAWDNPGTPGADPPVRTEIAYSVAPAGGPRCDVSAWTELHPISHAYHDSANGMPGRYGFARYPLRDGEGALIPDGVDLGASYPWIDRDGDNLFFTLLSSTYFYDDETVVDDDASERFPGSQCIDGTVPGGGSCLNPADASQIALIEEAKIFRGFA